MTSSLVLAILLHFNAFFSCAFGVVIARSVLAHMLVRSFTTELDIIMIAATILWWLAEAVRLQFGHKGNVAEQVPALAVFALMSLCFQLPIVVYLGFFQEAVSIAISVLASLMIALLAPEIIIAYRTLRVMMKVQTEAFYQSYELDQEQQRLEREQKEADILYWTRELNRLDNQGGGSSGKK
mmetsp:Transcript_28656/g.63089  ORF Transcript_28656/g.63089 Transcript_28656/m.63089 type:complete len:182 (-) Transcript_28656:1560-2105(-)